MTVLRGSALALLVSVSSLALTMGERPASAQQTAQQTLVLDPITVLATKTPEKTTDALAPVSVIGQDKIETTQPKRISDLFYYVPGLWTQDRGDDPATTINVRGLQDFGRVATIVDGARQNYQRSGHGAQGSFFLDPNLIGSVDVVRGPTANIYGSGAIGGVVSFKTKDIDDVVRPGEKWGMDVGGSIGSNKLRGDTSAFAGVRVNPNFDVFGGAVYRSQQNYKDGSGTEIGNTGLNASSGVLKLTARPATGHVVKLSGLFQEDLYKNGQLNRGPVATAQQRALYQGSSAYDSNTQNYQGTLRWKYSRPEDRLFDFDLGLYASRTETDQHKIYHYSTSGGAYCNGGTGNNISGCVGDPRSYAINTIGFDFNNTSRVAIGNWENAFTYGVDGFQDDVSSSDSRGNSNITTPGGKRTVAGGFLQWKANYASWLEVVSAARYDHYKLESASTTTDGSRLSPKVTVGVTPVRGIQPYVSYAEGYRAPSVTETLIAGAHATGGGPAFFTCPDGTTGLFCFLPNPNLRPEVGKNKEVGINFKFDGLFAKGDAFRAKINAFQNDVDDYIDLVASTPVAVPPFGTFSQFYQYQNIPSARIRGLELEANYDAGGWFVGVNGTLQKGQNTQTGAGLASIQPARVTTTAGLRLIDRKLTLSAQWSAVAANNDLPAGYIPSTSYNLVNLYATYQATKDVLINLGIDNVFNEYYRPYAIPGSSTDGTSQNDMLWTSPGPGITYKAAIKVHFGGV
ncbi:TonB-dependent hemoglobin/transferrin/lactoferrin family receptor [Undibacter mobilis]|uniref:TonB-dependent hemoglobin/transferrin/lactoferrin family receptor n=1 Tax=Undibacter mobilis TaxID=2292256 RepID=A0A371B7K9_9BRAD|nr:TonB-dependent hemoglobin/transferrin/lactoferrin family receptor [Undibacter mobilis]RDV03568.1 TonB-dependent hemoglobin/transferrin/lactoferrin family receptor [Undibacter mobilis]